MRIIRKLSHPNIVSIYGQFPYIRSCFLMVLELMDGGELFDRIVKKVMIVILFSPPRVFPLSKTRVLRGTHVSKFRLYMDTHLLVLKKEHTCYTIAHTALCAGQRVPLAPLHRCRCRCYCLFFAFKESYNEAEARDVCVVLLRAVKYLHDLGVV